MKIMIPVMQNNIITVNSEQDLRANTDSVSLLGRPQGDSVNQFFLNKQLKQKKAISQYNEYKKPWIIFDQ